MEKTDLSACNMAARDARKADCERVQVAATAGDGSLRTSQRTTQPKEIYDTMQQDSAGLRKTGVGPAYFPKGTCGCRIPKVRRRQGNGPKVSAHM